LVFKDKLSGVTTALSSSICFRADGLQHDNDVLEKKLKDLTAVLSSKDAQFTRVRKERDDLCAEVGMLKC